MKIYYGSRVAGPARVRVTVRALAQDQSILSEGPLEHIEYHSPDGFEWGYPGSGPADLALAILADYFKAEYGPVTRDDINFGGHPAVDLHQQFKFDVVSRMDGRQWSITSDDIDEWYEQQNPHLG